MDETHIMHDCNKGHNKHSQSTKKCLQHSSGNVKIVTLTNKIEK